MVVTLAAGVLSMLGAGPAQEGVPPRPSDPEWFSGTALVRGAPAPAGSQLVACIEDCDRVFASKPAPVKEGGRYSNLAVDPKDPELVGRPISFYLVNQFGRIRAVETPAFKGSRSFITLNLTFNQPAPTPPPPPTPTPTATPTPTPAPSPTPLPTPSLPVPGDPRVTAIPPLALGLGAGALLGGILLLLVARRRAF